MTFQNATTGYEEWLRGFGPLDAADLAYKHTLMADAADPFPFFRGTYYRWARLWPEVCGDLGAAPPVLAVGDLHVENFGTWRDSDGRLCWGVNDFDEADELPYTNDLVRLAASVLFARKTEKAGGLTLVKFRPACAAILDGYGATLDAGGDPFVLEERHPGLRAMAMSADRDPVAFWKKLTKVLADPPADPPAAARAALTADLPSPDLTPEFRRRPRGGVGSLGKARYVALAQWGGGWVAREAKAVAPPATAWAAGDSRPSRMRAAVAGAKRCPDPFYQPGVGRPPARASLLARRVGPTRHRHRRDRTVAVDGGRNGERPPRLPGRRRGPGRPRPPARRLAGRRRESDGRRRYRRLGRVARRVRADRV